MTEKEKKTENQGEAKKSMKEEEQEQYGRNVKNKETKQEKTKENLNRETQSETKAKQTENAENKNEGQKPDDKASESKDKKQEGKNPVEEKIKRPQKPIVKKYEAVARGHNLHISKKHGMYVCSFIKGKGIEEAIKDLEKVIKMRKAVPFKGEIPHRKGRIMSGRYPIKASKLFINVLKGLKGNVLVNGMDFDKTVIHNASASWARRPAKRGGRNAKRTNIIIKAKESEPEKWQKRTKNG